MREWRVLMKVSKSIKENKRKRWKIDELDENNNKGINWE